jgi:hypothetical protein
MVFIAVVLTAPVSLTTEVVRLRRSENGGGTAAIAVRNVYANRWQASGGSTRSGAASWFAPRLGAAPQDGGQQVSDMSNLFNGKKLRGFRAEFFPPVPSGESNVLYEG